MWLTKYLEGGWLGRNVLAGAVPSLSGAQVPQLPQVLNYQPSNDIL